MGVDVDCGSSPNIGGTEMPTQHKILDQLPSSSDEVIDSLDCILVYGINAFEFGGFNACIVGKKASRANSNALTREVLGSLAAIKKIQMSGSKERQGKNAAVVAKMLRSLGQVLFARGDYNGAYHAYNEELRTRETIVGSQQDAITTTIERICAIHLVRKDWENLLHDLLKLLELKMEALGDEHIETSLAFKSVGDAHRLTGKTNLALRSYKEALAIASATRDCKTEAALLQRIGDMNFIGRDYQEAYLSYQGSLEICQNPVCLHKAGLSLSLLRPKDNYQAIRCLKEVLAEKRECFFDDDRNRTCDGVTGGKAPPTLASGIVALDQAFETVSYVAMLKNTATVFNAMGEYSYAQEAQLEVDSILRDGHSNVLSTFSVADEEEFKSQISGCNESEASQIVAFGFEPAATERENEIVGAVRGVHFSHPLVTCIKEVQRVAPAERRRLFYSEADFKKFKRSKRNMNSAGETFPSGQYFEHVAEKLGSVGKTYFVKGEYDRALEAYTHALRVKTELGPDEHVSHSSTIQAIGDVFVKQDVLQKALEAYQAALKLRRSGLSDTHYTVSVTLVKMARVLEKLDHTSEAIDAYLEVVRVRRLHLGDHILTGKTLEMIGILSCKLGRYRQALEYFREALRIKEHVGLDLEEDDEIACTLTNLGNVYYTMGRKKAVHCYTRSLKIMKKNVASNQENIASTLVSLGYALLDQRKYELSTRAFNDALQFTVLRLGPGSVDASTMCCDAAAAFKEAGIRSTAVALCEEALLIVNSDACSSSQSSIIEHELDKCYAEMGRGESTRKKRKTMGTPQRRLRKNAMKNLWKQNK